MKKFPKTVYAKWEEADNEPFLVATESAHGMADFGAGRVKLGVYRLDETISIEAVTKITGSKKAK